MIQKFFRRFFSVLSFVLSARERTVRLILGLRTQQRHGVRRLPRAFLNLKLLLFGLIRAMFVEAELLFQVILRKRKQLRLLALLHVLQARAVLLHSQRHASEVLHQNILCKLKLTLSK